MEAIGQIKLALEKVIQETVAKEGLTAPVCNIEVFLVEGGRFDYLIEYVDKDGKPASLGFRNIRPVEVKDFDDPKFRVRLIHNLDLWLKAQESIQARPDLPLRRLDG